MKIRFALPVLTATLVMFSVSPFCLAGAFIAPAFDTVVGLQVGVIEVPINILSVSDLWSYQFDVAYDPTILNLASVSEGPFLPLAGPTIFMPGFGSPGNQLGISDTVLANFPGVSGGVSGPGVLAILEFLPLAPGVSQLVLSNVALRNSAQNDIAFTSAAGQVVINTPEPKSLPLAGGLLAACAWLVSLIRARRIGVSKM